MNKILRLVVVLSAGLGLVGVFIFVLPTSAAREASPQANIVVDTLQDELNSDADCSLREAITAANDNIPTDACPAGDGVLTDTITFDVSGTIILTGQLTIGADGPLIIDGGDVITISGGDNVRIFFVDWGADLSLERLALVDGHAISGGGIWNEGTLTLIDSTLSGNSAGSYGGGIYNNEGEVTIMDSTLSGNSSLEGGGIYNNGGTLNVTNSTLSGNSVGSQGGGIVNAGTGTLTITDSTLSGNRSDSDGGGIYNWGTLTITNSTLAGNSSSEGGGITNKGMLTLTGSTLSGNSGGWAGGGILNVGTLNVTDSTLSGNSASYGGGILNNGGTLNIANSTLSGNSASEGGGIANAGTGPLTITDSTLSGNSADYDGGGIFNNGGTLTLTYSTLAGNSALYGGGIYNLPGSSVSVLNSIIANSPTGGNCAGDPITDAGYNIEDTDTCGFDPANGSMPDTDPLLGPLRDNGGSTWTHALLTGSPAVDAADPAVCPLTDQRGVPRPVDGDGDGAAMCDIGSYESAPRISIAPNVLTSTQFVNEIVTRTLTISNSNGVTLTFRMNEGITSDAVMLLHVDEPAGATTFYDSSGNGNQGTCSNPSCPTAGINGIFGNAVQFDGVDDSVSVDDHPSLNPENAITLDAWVFVTNSGTHQDIISKDGELDDRQYLLTVTDASPPKFRAHIGVPGGFKYVDGATPVQLNQWYYVAMTYDGVFLKLYVNGVLDGSLNVNGTIISTTQPLRIGGGAPAGTPFYFQGLIDEIAIYDRALSGQEIEALYLYGLLYSGGAPWLSVDPISGTVTVNNPATITVTFDADGLQPDIFTSTLLVRNNDPQSPYVSIPVTMTVLAANTTMNILSNTPDPSLPGQPFTVTYAVFSDFGVPSGAVTVTVAGDTAMCTGTLFAGTGDCEITLITPRTYTLTATYSGDNFFLPSSSERTHTVQEETAVNGVFLPLIQK